MRERPSNSSGMGSRKRKYREEDQLDEEEAVWQESKRQAVGVEVCWTSPDEWAQRVTEEALSSTTNEETSDLELLDGLSIGKNDRQEEANEIVLTSEDTDTPDEANKENADAGNSTTNNSSDVGSELHTCTPSTQSDKELPSTLSPWLLTPPLTTQSLQFQSTSSNTSYGSPPRMPLPSGLGWADSTEVWDILVSKEKRWGILRNPGLFSSHPSLEPRMRSILLDWLMEVCEVYKLHRETYYLAQDFIDRFLSAQVNVPKQQLQLIGITSLFIAAKVEEIYPPKICEFAYVTDGACDENEILEKELIILKALKWDLSSVTVNSWLTIFLQLYGQDGTETRDDEEDDGVWESAPGGCSSNGKHRVDVLNQTRHSRRRRGKRRSFVANAPSNILKPPSGSTFVFPQFPGIALVRAAFLADFATLDAASLRFPYSVIAASTLYHVMSKEVALCVSGFNFADIKPCVDWMSAFAIELKESGAMTQLPTQLESVWARLGLGTASGDGSSRGSALLKAIPRLVVDDSHNIQTHLVDLDLLEKAQERLARMTSEQVKTPPLVLTLSTSSSPTSSRDTDESSPAKSLALLTPPASSVKSFSGSSSVGNVNITPSNASTTYRSPDFCVG